MGRDAFALAMDLAGEGGKAGIKLTALSCCKVGPALCSATACARKATPGSRPTSSRIPQLIFGWCWVYSDKLKIGCGGLHFSMWALLLWAPSQEFDNPETFRNLFGFCPFQGRKEEGGFFNQKDPVWPWSLPLCILIKMENFRFQISCTFLWNLTKMFTEASDQMKHFGFKLSNVFHSKPKDFFPFY